MSEWKTTKVTRSVPDRSEAMAAMLRRLQEAQQEHAKLLQNELRHRDKERSVYYPPEGVGIDFMGKKRKLHRTHFKTKADLVLLLLLLTENPEIEAVLTAVGFQVLDEDGEVIFPRSDLERLGDVEEE